EVDKLRDELAQLTGKEVGINVEEIKRPELDAQLVGDSVAHQLTQRISFRRAMKRAVQSAMRMGAQGIKIKTAGRLGGAEIARTEGYHGGACRCTRCAPTWITRSRPPRRRTGRSASKCGSSKASAPRICTGARIRRASEGGPCSRRSGANFARGSRAAPQGWPRAATPWRSATTG